MLSRNTYPHTWVSLTLEVGYLHGCSSKVQLLLLTLNKAYLLTTAPPDLERLSSSSQPSCACAAKVKDMETQNKTKQKGFCYCVLSLTL